MFGVPGGRGDRIGHLIGRVLNLHGTSPEVSEPLAGADGPAPRVNPRRVGILDNTRSRHARPRVIVFFSEECPMSVQSVLATAAAVSLSAVLIAAQQPTPDTVPATGGPITIRPLNHATLQLVHGSQVITVDPTAQASYEGLPRPTIILITHIHGDHFVPKVIADLRTPSTVVVLPQAAADQTPNPTVMANGDTRTINGLTIEAVPMYNLTRGPKPGQFYHPKGWGNGYIVTLGGKRIYIAGDTACTPEMKALTNIDVAFMPMNLPYTMTPAEAAGCARAFKPAVVYPYHYRGQDPADFQKALDGTGIDVRLRDWYATPATTH